MIKFSDVMKCLEDGDGLIRLSHFIFEGPQFRFEGYLEVTMTMDNMNSSTYSMVLDFAEPIVTSSRKKVTTSSLPSEHDDISSRNSFTYGENVKICYDVVSVKSSVDQAYSDNSRMDQESLMSVDGQKCAIVSENGSSFWNEEQVHLACIYRYAVVTCNIVF